MGEHPGIDSRQEEKFFVRRHVETSFECVRFHIQLFPGITARGTETD